MRKKINWVVTALMLSLFLGAGSMQKAQADAASDAALKAARKGIQAGYSKRDATSAKLDYDGFWSTRTKNYVWISKDGRRKGIKQLREETRRLFNAAESINGRAAIQKITLKGNTATVLIKDSGTVVIPAKNKKNVIKVTERASDTWVKSGNKWLLSQSRSLASYVTVNGKQVK